MMKTKLVTVGLAVVLMFSLYSLMTSQAQEDPTITPEPTTDMGGMSSMNTEFSADDFAPLVLSIYEGEYVYFIHTEASDSAVATLLTDMMGPQVVTVPSLAEVPEELLGKVYAFTNGIVGAGPMGFQPDIFDSVPGDPDYTPLRVLHTVTWQEGSTPHLLNSAAELEAAENDGEVAIENTEIVVNMPILIWPNGQR